MGGGGGMLPDFFFCYIFPVQQTTSGIGNRVKKYHSFFRVGNQYAECEKQQLTFFPPDWGLLRRSRCVLIFL